MSIKILFDSSELDLHRELQNQSSASRKMFASRVSNSSKTRAPFHAFVAVHRYSSDTHGGHPGVCVVVGRSGGVFKSIFKLKYC